MAKVTAQLVVLTNATAPEREAEFNAWYNKIHAVEVCAVDGFGGMRRYRATKEQPFGGMPSHKYLAIYDLFDTKRAIKAFEKAALHFRHSDSVDRSNAVSIVFDAPLFEYKKAVAKPKAKVKLKSKSKPKPKPKPKRKSK